MSKPGRKRAANRRAAKQAVITFKSDAALAAALSSVENRSEFIRQAVLSALDSVCPFCHGTGILTPHQRKHWDEFAAHHQVVACDTCREPRLVCRSRRRP